MYNVKHFFVRSKVIKYEGQASGVFMEIENGTRNCGNIHDTLLNCMCGKIVTTYLSHVPHLSRRLNDISNLCRSF